MLTPEQAQNEIRIMGFPNIFHRIWANEFPFGLCSMCCRPTTFYRLAGELVQRLPRLTHCVPLWEENGGQIVAYDKASGEFISLCFEDRECRVIGRTYQQFVSSFFIALVYSGMTDRLHEMAELFQYRHLSELMRWAEVDDDESCEESERRFLDSITD